MDQYMEHKETENSKTTVRRMKWVFSIGTIVPIALLTILVVQHYVNFFVWDELSLVPFFEKMLNGGVSVGDWLRPHNDHQIFFPKLVMVGFLTLFNFELLPLLILNLFLALVGFYLINKVQRESIDESARRHLLVIFSSFIFFSLLQWENFLRFWQIQLIMCIVSYIAASYFLFYKKTGKQNTLIALVFSAVSTFSFGNGIIGLFVNGFLLLLDPAQGEDRKQRLITYFTGLGVISIMFFITFTTGGSEQSSNDLIRNIVKVPVFFLFFIGQIIVYPFYGNKILAALSLSSGALGVVVFLSNTVTLYMNRGAIKREQLFLYSLSFWVILSALIIAVGRISFGLETSVSSRYSSFSTLFWISNLTLFLWLFGTKERPMDWNDIFSRFFIRRNKPVLWVVILILVTGTFNSLSTIWRFPNYERTTKPALSEYYHLSANGEVLKAVYPDSLKFAGLSETMRKIKLTPFHEHPVFPYESIESIKSVQEKGFSGVIDKFTPQVVQLELDALTPYYDLIQGKIEGVEHDDMLIEYKSDKNVKYFRLRNRISKKDTDNGFFALVSFRDLDNGEYTRKILARNNGKWSYLKGERKLVVEQHKE